MIQEIMEEVKAAESQASALIEDARLQAMKIEEEEKRQVTLRKQEARQEQARYRSETQKKAVEKGEAYAAEIAKETETAIADLRKDALKKQRQAIDLVIRNLV